MGIKYKLKVSNIKDLSREVVKTEWATVCIPEIEFEIPARTQAGVITTIEGLLDRAISGLSERLLSIKDEDPEIFPKVSSFIVQLKNLLEVKEPFIFEMDDPSGNSFLQNFSAPQKDENLRLRYYKRTSDQDKFLGIAIPEEPTSDIVGEEVFTFSTNCPNCNAPCETHMKMTQIPHFKETVIMATNCDSCGHRTNEVKGGGGIEPFGSLLKLQIQNREDLNRDVLKSETCEIRIPDLDFEVGSGALGGRFTTVEGLLQNIKEQLQEHNPMVGGDSIDPSLKTRMEDFLSQIDKILSLEKPVMIILDDPCGNSYIQNTVGFFRVKIKTHIRKFLTKPWITEHLRLSAKWPCQKSKQFFKKSTVLCERLKKKLHVLSTIFYRLKGAPVCLRFRLFQANLNWLNDDKGVLNTPLSSFHLYKFG